jgi:hypothetical protein
MLSNRDGATGSVIRCAEAVNTLLREAALHELPTNVAEVLSDDLFGVWKAVWGKCKLALNEPPHKHSNKCAKLALHAKNV